MALQVGHWQRSTRGLATPSGGYDAVIIGGGACNYLIDYSCCSVFLAGPGGYVAAIKAAQLGLKVCLVFCLGLSLNPWTRSPPDCMYREAWDSWWNVLERRMYSIQSYAQQLAHLPPNTPRYSEAWHRRFVSSFLYRASSNLKNGRFQLKALN